MENLSSEPIIKCTVAANGEVGSCTSYELSAGGTTEDNPIKYFVDGSTYPTIKSVIQCTFNDKCKLIDAVKSTSSASDHFYYIHGEDDGIIDCTGGSTPKCVAVAVGDADGYYIDGYDDKSIITCNSGCSSEKFVGIAANGDSRTGEVFIQCTGSSACTYISSIPDNNAFKGGSGNSSFETKESNAISIVGYRLLSKENSKALLKINSGIIIKVEPTKIKKGKKWNFIVIINEIYFIKKI